MLDATVRILHTVKCRKIIMWGKLRKILSPAPLNSILKLGGIIIYFHLFLKLTTSLLIFLWISFLHQGSKRTLKAQINSQRLPENQVRSLQIFCVYPADQKPPQNFSPSQNKENRKDFENSISYSLVLEAPVKGHSPSLGGSIFNRPRENRMVLHPEVGHEEPEPIRPLQSSAPA